MRSYVSGTPDTISLIVFTIPWFTSTEKTNTRGGPRRGRPHKSRQKGSAQHTLATRTSAPKMIEWLQYRRTAVASFPIQPSLQVRSFASLLSARCHARRESCSPPSPEVLCAVSNFSALGPSILNHKLILVFIGHAVGGDSIQFRTSRKTHTVQESACCDKDGSVLSRHVQTYLLFLPSQSSTRSFISHLPNTQSNLYSCDHVHVHPMPNNFTRERQHCTSQLSSLRVWLETLLKDSTFPFCIQPNSNPSCSCVLASVSSSDLSLSTALPFLYTAELAAATSTSLVYSSELSSSIVSIVSNSSGLHATGSILTSRAQTKIRLIGCRRKSTTTQKMTEMVTKQHNSRHTHPWEKVAWTKHAAYRDHALSESTKPKCVSHSGERRADRTRMEQKWQCTPPCAPQERVRLSLWSTFMFGRQRQSGSHWDHNG